MRERGDGGEVREGGRGRSEGGGKRLIKTQRESTHQWNPSRYRSQKDGRIL